MIDYSAVLFDPVYDVLGVSAMLTTTSGVVDITVIDATRSKSNVSGLLETRSVGPAAYARMPELIQKGVDRSDWDGGVLAFNDRIWIIRSHELRGSPNGEFHGEVHFFLRSSDD